MPSPSKITLLSHFNMVPSSQYVSVTLQLAVRAKHSRRSAFVIFEMSELPRAPTSSSNVGAFGASEARYWTGGYNRAWWSGAAGQGRAARATTRCAASRRRTASTAPTRVAPAARRHLRRRRPPARRARCPSDHRTLRAARCRFRPEEISPRLSPSCRRACSSSIRFCACTASTRMLQARSRRSRLPARTSDATPSPCSSSTPPERRRTRPGRAGPGRLIRVPR